MKRIVAALVASLLAATTPAFAQHDGAAESVPDVPSGTARLVGTIENPDAPAKVGEIEVLLYALPPNGTPGLRRGRSDAEGRFVFEGISNDPATSYLVGARYAGIPYPGERIAFAAGESEKQISVRVGEPSEDASKIAIPETQIEVAWAGGRIGVSELVRFENRGAQTVFVPAPRRGEAEPLYRAELPAGAEDFQIPLGIQPEGLVRDGHALRFYGPLYPSSWPGPLAREQGLAFQYTLPAAGGPVTIEKTFPSGTKRLVVLTPANGPEIEIAGAREEAPEAQPAGGAPPARRLVVDGVAPGGRVALQFAVPETVVDPDAVHLEETRIFLELDDAALQVQEEHVFVVHGEKPVIAKPGEALLAIPIPAEAQQVRFDRDAFALGLAPDDGNGALLRGPLPPGETRVQIAYHLPVTDPGASTLFEKRFGRTLPLLSIYAADTGLAVESERLHRRRPVKTPDRTYLALEAFQVEPSESVRLSIAPLPARAQMPRVALLGGVALAAALVIGFVAAPLRAGSAGRAADAEPEERVDQSRREREAIYAALRDLEHDHETAKVSDEDYADMRRELRGRAAALLAAEEAATPPALRVEPIPADPVCGGCGAKAHAGDRFCAQCGAKLPGAEARV